MKLLKIAAIIAILSAVFLFIYSIINLILFGIQQGALSPSANAAISFVTLNLKSILTLSQIILFLAAIIIYLAFLKISSKFKLTPLSISIYLVIITNLIFFLAIMSSLHNFSALQALSKIEINKLEALIGLSFIIFGILLFTLKSKLKESIIIALGILYIIQGISLISTLNIPIRLVDFTIAIRILESVLLFAIAKHHLKIAY